MSTSFLTHVIHGTVRGGSTSLVRRKPPKNEKTSMDSVDSRKNVCCYRYMVLICERENNTRRRKAVATAQHTHLLDQAKRLLP